MDKQQNQQRIKNLFKMLLEMATGNLAFRLESDGSGDELDELVILLNALAEKMQLVISQPKFVNKMYWHQKTSTTSKQSDSALIQKVLDYIQNHLEEPLPSTKELSKKFGTNEYTLKDNFRKALKTSIYQYYNDERLKKAYLLIQKTSIPIKEIALTCGFNDYPNFYKAFKKRFNEIPSNLKTNNTDDDNA